MSLVKISIIIPTLGNEANLKKLLNSISAQDLNSSEAEVLIVVNGLDRSEFERLNLQIQQSSKLNLVWIYNEVANVNAARNKGLELAKSDLLYFLDDDCELLNKSTLNFHINSHNQDEKLFAIGGGYDLPENSGYWDELYNSIQMAWLYSGKRGMSADVMHLLGGNFSLKKELAQKNKLHFDERIAYGGSEHKFFVEAASLDLKMQLANVSVRHNTQESFLNIGFKVFKQGRGKAIIELDASSKDEASNSGFISTTTSQYVAYANAKEFIFKKIFNYAFWFGYYKEKRKPYMLVVKIVKDLFNYLNFLRFKIIDKFK